MIHSDKQLNELRKTALEVVRDQDIPNIASQWAIMVVQLVDDIHERQELHREEQRRSADRLRAALSFSTNEGGLE